jgi:hypothetical protein
MEYASVDYPRNMPVFLVNYSRSDLSDSGLYNCAFFPVGTEVPYTGKCTMFRTTNFYKILFKKTVLSRFIPFYPDSETASVVNRDSKHSKAQRHGKNRFIPFYPDSVTASIEKKTVLSRFIQRFCTKLSTGQPLI